MCGTCELYVSVSENTVPDIMDILHDDDVEDDYDPSMADQFGMLKFRSGCKDISTY